MSALERLGSAGVIPVVVVNDADDAAPLGAALARGGLSSIEVTLRTPAALAAIERLSGDPGVLVGAGTVVDPHQVDSAVDAGARFIVSPGLDVAVVRRCRALGVPVLPGVATPTEAMAALAEGVDVVKLFPAGPLGGPSMAAALAGPFPRLRLVPTGGIGVDDLPAYFAASNVLAVGGTWVAPSALVRQGRFDEIAVLAAAAAEAVVAARGQRRAAR
jgi:2-dehydro-3-deoxyphosphogluconate aldolase / (4S)-4-hydroxy-2-oxoglutarate aldolase